MHQLVFDSVREKELFQDDGGFPITGYKIDMLDIQTNNWLEITFIEVILSKSSNSLDQILISRDLSLVARCQIFCTALCTDFGECLQKRQNICKNIIFLGINFKF